jgi:hypothetical protein
MRRRVAAFLVALVVMSLVVVGSGASPASAKVCAGQGVAHLSQKIGLPLIGAKKLVGFTLSAKCTVGGGTATSFGTIGQAACGRSTGGKGTVNGKNFKFQTVASIGIIQGGVTGVFNAVSDVRKGDSCVSKTADDFIVTAVINGL